MSAEEAVQEVRRIFMNNSVEQAHDYLTTITRGIQESDERLKQIVGQSYRDLIAACDRVVGMEKTCKKLLDLQRRIRTDPIGFISRDGELPEYPHSPKSSTPSPTGAANTNTLDAVHSPPSSVALGVRASYNVTHGMHLLAQQRYVALEGLLGTQEVRRAAEVLSELRRRTNGSVTLLNSYKARLHRALRDTLRGDADTAARCAMAMATIGTSPAAHASTAQGTSRAGVEADGVPLLRGMSTAERERMAMTHMAEVHAALGIVTPSHAPHALLQLMELVAEMMESDLALWRLAAQKDREDSHEPLNWLLAVLPLPADLAEAFQRDSHSLHSALSVEGADGMGSCTPLASAPCLGPNSLASGSVPKQTSPHGAAQGVYPGGALPVRAAVALHILQRSQMLFSHLTAYVASVAPQLCGVVCATESDAATECGPVGKEEALEENEFMSNERQRRSLQNLLTLRGRLITQQQQQQQQEEHDNVFNQTTQDVRGSTDSQMTPLRRGGSLRRGFSLRQGSEDVLDASASLVLADGVGAAMTEQDSAKRKRARGSYLREVMLQVCGMQVLDPGILRQKMGEKQQPSGDSNDGKVVNNDHNNKSNNNCDGSDLHNRKDMSRRNVDHTAVSFDEVQQKVLSIQETVSRLIRCICDSSLLRDPFGIALQEQLALQGATRLKERLVSGSKASPSLPTALNGSVIFDETQWTAVIRETTERALVKSIEAALRRTDRVAQSILQRTRTIVPQGTLVSHEHETLTTTTTTPPVTSVPQLARRLLRRSLCVSASMSLSRGNNGAFAIPSKGVMPTGTPGKRGPSVAHQDALHAEIARAVVQCVWLQQKPSRGVSTAGNMATTTTASTTPGSRGAAFLPLAHTHTSESNPFIIGAAQSAVPLPSDIFAALGTDAVSEAEANRIAYDADALFSDPKEMKGEQEAPSALPDEAVHRGVHKSASRSAERDTTESAERNVLQFMLQRVLNAAQVTNTAKSAAYGLLMNWVTVILRRVQELMRGAEEEQQRVQAEPPSGKDARDVVEGRMHAMMVMFNRLSLFVEVLLQLVEAAGDGGTLAEELRQTIITCYKPWTRLLRSEWQNGLCTAYKEAIAALFITPITTSSIHVAGGGFQETGNASMGTTSAKRFSLEYALCWHRGNSECVESHLKPSSTVISSNTTDTAAAHASTKTTAMHSTIPPPSSSSFSTRDDIAHPIHVTPHVSELLFQLQHILHTTTRAGQRLCAIILPIVLSELLNGTTTSIHETVLPSLIAHNFAEEDRDEVLMQLYFDLLYLHSVFTSSSETPDRVALATHEVLQEIEKRADPVAWSLSAPPLRLASDALRRATALSFGAWSATDAVDVWSATGAYTTSQSSTHPSHPREVFHGAMCAPIEVERFPLLPLTTTGPSALLTSSLGTHNAAHSVSMTGVNAARSGMSASGDVTHSMQRSQADAKATHSGSLWGGESTARSWMGSLW